MQAAAELSNIRPTLLTPLSKMLLPALGKPYLKEADTIARATAIEAALAVAEFRARHRRLPIGVIELVPEYFSVPPVDPRSDTRLTLVPLDQGFQINGNGPMVTIEFARPVFPGGVND